MSKVLGKGCAIIAKEIAKETKNGNLYSVLGGGDTVLLFA